ncbi:DNA ligase I, ATP-dependent Dnl1 [Ferroglobus placidus DSM 10642]|uniref:DNA ligase n=1 Tax=Ferroglobus placidus (strain DSM 10642 / AEDII12DO) TaxID=589924 RepID=D3S0Y1_FERPA|nr:ATP-dependent DNA ligase [Ferroglobus placidus]ADC64217.1 DNA ligase I, ATP-dependent Dnl1 [Ferroglobus placidus DSM 10642]
MLTFKEFAEFCSVIEKISSTLELTARIAAFIRKIEDEDDLYNVIHFLMGRIFPPWDEREIGVGVGLIYEALRQVTGVSKSRIEQLVKETGDLGLAAERLLKEKKQTTLFQEELTIKRVKEIFEEMAKLSGEGSQKRRVMLLTDLYVSATPIETRYLTRLILGEMRLGVGEGIIRDAIARAFGIDSSIVERAYMLTNDYGRVAVVAKKEGKDGLMRMKIQLHYPVKMMLAQVAESVDEALREMREAAVEWKYDGSRVQVHYGNGKVTIFSRRLENVTSALPEIVDEVKKCVRENVILDGEVIAVKDGKPMPFQQVLRRFRRKHEISKAMERIPLIVYFFDILYDGEMLIDLPLKERRKKLEEVIGESEIIKVAQQVITSDPKVVEEEFNRAIEAGHEGLMLKRLDSPYTPGKRGKLWLKLKAVMETLDLVVVGGEWGEGKRSHLLSSFELACRDENGRLLRVGKVATGFTDEDLEELTELFKPLIEYEEGKRVVFQPKYLFEVAYQEIQKSPKYESGFALRFPRFVRLRDDKSVEEADTLERIAKLYEMQFKSKGG